MKHVSISTKQVNEFIEDMLVMEIFHDLSDVKLKIISEADLQSIVYFHLRKFLEKDSRWKIFNKQPIKRSGRGGIYPDLTLFRSLPKIAIELKEHSRLGKKDVKMDANKLLSLRKSFKKGYIIYVTRENKSNSDQLYGKANTWLEGINKNNKNYVTALVINAFDKMDPKTKIKYVRLREKYAMWHN